MTPTEFLTKYFPFALQVQQKYGVPAQAILAQAALESGWGKSKLTQEANNFFGIKADSSWTGPVYNIKTREVKDGKESFPVQPFRKYATPFESFENHALFLLKNPRYKAAFNYKDDPKQFVAEVAKAGYATDPKYTELLHKLIDGSSNILSKISTSVVQTVKQNPGKSGLGLLALLAALYFFSSGRK